MYFEWHTGNILTTVPSLAKTTGLFLTPYWLDVVVYVALNLIFFCFAYDIFFSEKWDTYLLYIIFLRKLVSKESRLQVSPACNGLSKAFTVCSDPGAKRDDWLIIQRASEENHAFHGRTEILKRFMYVQNMTHLIIYICQKTSLLQRLLLLQQFTQKIMCFPDLGKTDWSFLHLFALWCLFPIFFSCELFLKGCFSASTVYVSTTHSVTLMIDDVFWLHSPWNPTIVRHAR